MLTHFVIALRHLRTPPERPLAFRRLSLLSARRGSQAKPAARSAGKTLREEKAADKSLSLWRTIRDRKERSDGIAKRSEASARRGSQAKPAARSAGKTLREEKAVTRKECAKAHTGFAPQCEHCYHAGAGNDSPKRCFFRPFESLDTRRKKRVSKIIAYPFLGER